MAYMSHDLMARISYTKVNRRLFKPFTKFNSRRCKSRRAFTYDSIALLKLLHKRWQQQTKGVVSTIVDNQRHERCKTNEPRPQTIRLSSVACHTACNSVPNQVLFLASFLHNPLFHYACSYFVKPLRFNNDPSLAGEEVTRIENMITQV